jgi:hypothetical protein
MHPLDSSFCNLLFSLGLRSQSFIKLRDLMERKGEEERQAEREEVRSVPTLKLSLTDPPSSK